MTRPPVGPDGRYKLPKLTAEDLRGILNVYPHPEVRTLLWEIYRLRLLVLRADQLTRVMDAGCAATTQQVLATLRDELVGEPCIKEDAARRRDLFGQG